ncbi:2-oxoglutarate and iron-dependent oxygenase JMJD4 [Diorhabda sublineata]|uniref:2-oxoglutarate and iron-dependent oxygenase JMJD4 n=1 Tax=Diorhabda sublineata TaxID=1163346 RepID=UPI0024E08217|nr:2-oxoglutarate and iron-dependent oxygenase JMJD4 [Diorhabda sublineata]
MVFEIDCQVDTNITYNYDSIDSIPSVDASDLTYASFFSNYMLPNIPCIIKGITDNWQCSSLWIKDEAVNFDYLSEQYGSDLVHVYKCRERFYNTQKCYTGSFKDYLNTFQENTSRASILTINEYVKNWHLSLQHPEDKFYEVPLYFASDWLNEFCVNNLEDDYRFVYMGPSGTWTPFHHDVFSSYSWSANIIGTKKWIMVPPGSEEYAKDSLGNLIYDIQSIASSEDTPQSLKVIEVFQNAGEAIFVPSGWHHQVHNFGYTISVNHNWVNGCNVHFMYDLLLKTLEDVKVEISDCNDMEGFEDHCQLMLNSLFGMDFKTFYQFLMYIALKRIEMQNNACSKQLFHGHEIGSNHILFDLKAVKGVLEKFVKCDEITEISAFETINVTPQDLLDDVVHNLEINGFTEYKFYFYFIPIKFPSFIYKSSIIVGDALVGVEKVL